MNKVTKHQTGFTAALTRELQDYRHRGAEFLLSITVLLASMIAVAWIFTSGTLMNLPIAVIDQDGSSLSRSYIRMLEASPQMHIVDHPSSPIEARELLEQATVYAVVLIPRDFSKDIKTGRQATVVGWHSGQFLTMSGVLSKSLRQVTATMSAGIEMTSLSKRGVSSQSAEVRFEQIQPELRTLFNPFQNYQYFLIAGLLPAMLQVFVMVWTVFVVGREFRDHSSSEWLAPGTSAGAAIAAKALPVFIIASVIGFACLIWLFGIAGWPVSGSLGLLILGWELMIGAYITLGILFAGFTSNLATALSFTAFFTAPAFAYAGVTFPQQSMPILAQIWSYAMPVRTLIRLQVEQVEIGAPLSSSMLEIIILLAFILIPLPFAIGRIRRRCAAASAGTE